MVPNFASGQEVNTDALQKWQVKVLCMYGYWIHTPLKTQTQTLIVRKG